VKIQIGFFKGNDKSIGVDKNNIGNF